MIVKPDVIKYTIGTEPGAVLTVYTVFSVFLIIANVITIIWFSYLSFFDYGFELPMLGWLLFSALMFFHVIKFHRILVNMSNKLHKNRMSKTHALTLTADSLTIHNWPIGVPGTYNRDDVEAISLRFGKRLAVRVKPEVIKQNLKKLSYLEKHILVKSKMLKGNTFFIYKKAIVPSGEQLKIDIEDMWGSDIKKNYLADATDAVIEIIGEAPID